MSFTTSLQCTQGACCAGRGGGVGGCIPLKSQEFAGCKKAEGSLWCGIILHMGRGTELHPGKDAG